MTLMREDIHQNCERFLPVVQTSYTLKNVASELNSFPTRFDIKDKHFDFAYMVECKGFKGKLGDFNLDPETLMGFAFAKYIGEFVFMTKDRKVIKKEDYEFTVK
jgi:hypothetical protein